MKKMLGFSSLALMCGLVAQEEATLHCFTPKVFYRHHNEQAYKYDTLGIGLQYHLNRPEGINVKLSIITNPNSKDVLAETENTIFFKIPVEDGVYLFPIVSSRFCSHNQHSTEEEKCIHKQTFFAGIGAYFELGEHLHLRMEAQGFRDIQNSLRYQKNDRFWGRCFSNPYGARAKLALLGRLSPKAIFEVEGNYGTTFPQCYHECGAEISFSWGF